MYTRMITLKRLIIVLAVTSFAHYLSSPVDAMIQQSLSSRRASDCPSLCTCTTWLQLLKATCTGVHLYSVHTGVPSVVQALDLSNNSINQLEDRQLSRAGLTRLKYLNLSMNVITEIGINAFEDLKNLTVLDLSMNHIDYIAPYTFYHNQNLRILHLAGNKFNLHVPKLHSTSITKLYLSGCRINQLSPENFEGLKQLRKLDLSNNMLYDLDKDVLKVMPFLKSLSLAKNHYWSCDASTFNLKLYLRSRDILTDTFCEKFPMTAKFEKIIALKSINTEAEPKPINQLAESSRNAKGPWDVDSWRELEEAVQEQEQSPESESTGILASALSNVSPFWFLLIGFLLGSGATMVVTYLWLSTTISCLIPRIRRAEAADSVDASSQRVSLLRHLWQQESLANSDDGSTTLGNNGSTTTTAAMLQAAMIPSCPGTPPPPYREVMLHRNLYPRAAMVAAAAAAQQNGTMIRPDPMQQQSAYNI